MFGQFPLCLRHNSAISVCKYLAGNAPVGLSKTVKAKRDTQINRARRAAHAVRIKALTRLFFACCIVICLSSCLAAPGKGSKARAGYRAAAPAILALEKFHGDHSRYPTNLDELVPAYLPDSKAFIAQQKVKPVLPYSLPATSSHEKEAQIAPYDLFWYQRDGDAYILRFTYFGPGVCTCGYCPTTRKWQASSHY